MDVRIRSNRARPEPTADAIRRMLQTSPTSSPITANDHTQVAANRTNKIAHGHRR
jgi:hypothetical protein